VFSIYALLQALDHATRKTSAAKTCQKRTHTHLKGPSTANRPSKKGVALKIFNKKVFLWPMLYFSHKQSILSQFYTVALI
jgi:hypothetical protein